MKQFAHFDGTPADRDVLRGHLAGKAWMEEWVRQSRPTQPGDGQTTRKEPGATCAAIRDNCGLGRAYLFSTRHKMNDGDEPQGNLQLVRAEAAGEYFKRCLTLENWKHLAPPAWQWCLKGARLNEAEHSWLFSDECLKFDGWIEERGYWKKP